MFLFVIPDSNCFHCFWNHCSPNAIKPPHNRRWSDVVASCDSMMRLSGTEGTDGGWGNTWARSGEGGGLHIVKPPCAKPDCRHRHRTGSSSGWREPSQHMAQCLRLHAQMINDFVCFLLFGWTCSVLIPALCPPPPQNLILMHETSFNSRSINSNVSPPSHHYEALWATGLHVSGTCMTLTHNQFFFGA